MDGTPYIVWLENRDGETLRCEGFDTAEELLHNWPYAEKVSEHEYTAWIGGRR